MSTSTPHRPDPARIILAMTRRSTCMLSSVSSAGRPHVATVVYQFVDGRLYISTTETSRKARNIAEHPHVAVVIPVRRLPFGAPPSTIQFQAGARLLASDDPEIVSLARVGRLKAVTGHGELELPGGCFIRVDLPRRLHTYGLGMSLWELARHPLDGAGEVTLPARPVSQGAFSGSTAE